jgi:MFS family permease
MAGRETAAGWRATAAAALGLATGPSVILVFTFGVFVAPLQAEFGWSRPQIMFGATLIAFAVMFSAPVVGFLIDRFGARPVVLASAFPFSAGIAAFSFLDNQIAGFYVLCALLPFLGIGLWPVSYLRVVSAWFEKRLGLATGIANGGIGIGAALLPLIATALIERGGLRTCFVMLAVLGMAVAFPVNLWLLREPQAGGTAAARNRRDYTPDGFTFAETLRTRSFRLLMVAFFLLGIVNSLVSIQIPMLMDFGATPARAALVASVFGLTIVAGRFIVGALLDRVSVTLLMAVVCAGGFIACAIYASGSSGPSVFLSAILLGGVFGAEFDVLSFVVKRYFGLRAFGRTYGVVFALFQLGSALGAILLPLSRVYTGSYVLGLSVFCAAMAIVAACFILLGPAMSSSMGAYPVKDCRSPG